MPYKQIVPDVFMPRLSSESKAYQARTFRNVKSQRNSSASTRLKPIRIVIADDHPVVRQGLSAILAILASLNDFVGWLALAHISVVDSFNLPQVMDPPEAKDRLPKLQALLKKA
jgi:hypothetical protein